MISIWKKRSSNKSTYDICSMAEDTLDVALNKDTVEISFTSGTVNKSSDFIVSIGSDSRKKLIDMLLEALVLGRPKNITEYTKDELLEALTIKLKED